MSRLLSALLAGALLSGASSPSAFAAEVHSLQASTQEVVRFESDIQRVAVNDKEILGFKLIGAREMLVQAKKLGRTNLLVWLADGSVRDLDYEVIRGRARMEIVLEEAIQKLDSGVGRNVTVRRIVRGASADTEKDFFILEGKVPNQVALTRILTVAAKVLGDATGDDNISIRVVADEAGALLSQRETADPGASSGAGGEIFRSGSQGGGSLESALGNRIGRSIGRAKAIEAADGRLLSLIEVEDIPRVRVSMRILEVDRDRLLTYGSSSSTAYSSSTLPESADFVNTLQFLSGALTNQSQIGLDHFLVELVLGALETEGIARTLAEPTLSVLSGETAVFQVGGQVPVGAAAATGTVVVNTFEFVDFGVEMAIRPLVDEDDAIVLDVIPRVREPVVNTVSSIDSAPAFETQTIKTTARVRDGQVVLIGGLIKRSHSDQHSRTPGLGRIPLLGHLFRGRAKQDKTVDLVIVVNPVIERDPVDDLPLWHFPETSL